LTPNLFLQKLYTFRNNCSKSYESLADFLPSSAVNLSADRQTKRS
jgi:hypothetical protein